MTDEESLYQETFKLSKDLMEFFDDVAANEGNAQAQLAALRIISSIITYGVVRSLGINASNKKTTYEAAKKEFCEYKAMAQQAVAAGFQAGMSRSLEREIEYYCQIIAVPESTSNTIN